MRTILIALVSVLVIGGTNAWAGANCTCRGPGVEATIGETVCLKTPAGLRLARCEMVLNNTSWKFLPDACPQASLAAPGPLALAMSSMPEERYPLR
jgi:hypothetical protein